jgi:hypothetical protein
MIPKVSRLPVDILSQLLYYKTQDVGKTSLLCLTNYWASFYPLVFPDSWNPEGVFRKIRIRIVPTIQLVIPNLLLLLQSKKGGILGVFFACKVIG